MERFRDRFLVFKLKGTAINRLALRQH